MVDRFIHLLLQQHWSPLHHAAAQGYNDVVNSLLATRANVNCTNKVSRHIYCSMLHCTV